MDTIWNVKRIWSPVPFLLQIASFHKSLPTNQITTYSEEKKSKIDEWTHRTTQFVLFWQRRIYIHLLDGTTGYIHVCTYKSHIEYNT
jgi:hypothetical protein